MRLQLPSPGPRKEALVELAPLCHTGLEVGADHGIISAHLLASGTCARMIVSDISAASLDKARRLFALHGLKADFRVADGFSGLDTPVDVAVIAGMGSQTAINILACGHGSLGGAALVLQVNTGLPDLRRWLMEHGYCIEAERLVREGRRFYVGLRAVEGAASYTEKELYLGPCLLVERPPLWGKYLTWRRGCLLRMHEGQENRLAWIEEELKAI